MTDELQATHDAEAKQMQTEIATLKETCQALADDLQKKDRLCTNAVTRFLALKRDTAARARMQQAFNAWRDEAREEMRRKEVGLVVCRVACVFGSWNTPRYYGLLQVFFLCFFSPPCVVRLTPMCLVVLNACGEQLTAKFIEPMRRRRVLTKFMSAWRALAHENSRKAEQAFWKVHHRGDASERVGV